MDINYEESIMIFKSMTNCYDDEKAWEFLTNCDWNVAEAAEIYNISFSSNDNQSNKDIGYISSFNNQNTYSNTNPNKKESKDTNKGGRSEFVNYLVEILNLFNHPNIDSFKKTLGSKIGLIIIYDEIETELLSEILFALKENEHIMDILNANYSVYFMSKSTTEAQNFQDTFKIRGVSFITLFVHDPDFLYNKNKNFILDKIEGFLELSYLCEKITENSSKICKKPHKISESKPRVKDYVDEANMSHSALLEKQKNELLEIERQAAESEFKKIKEQEELKRKAEEEMLQTSNLKKKLSSERKNRENLKKNLLPEPNDNDPNKALIAFRLPNGETIQRKFNKYYKVVELYNFINTIENLLEDDNSSFDLITLFPMKIYNQYDITLEEAGLFPNSVIQVREL